MCVWVCVGGGGLMPFLTRKVQIQSEPGPREAVSIEIKDSFSCRSIMLLMPPPPATDEALKKLNSVHSYLLHFSFVKSQHGLRGEPI